MSKKRIEPELQSNIDNGSELEVKPKPFNRTEEVVLTVTRKVRQKEEFIIDLSLSELNNLVEDKSKAVKAIELQIKDLKGKAQAKAIEACNDVSDLDFDQCVENKTKIHEKHLGLEAFIEHLEQEVRDLNDKILHKLREIRKCQQQT